jgi:hypothetical protein
MRNADSDNNPDNHGMMVGAMPAGVERPNEEYPAQRQPLDLPSHDALAQLARNDPEAYEALRRKVVDGFIDSAPARLKSRLCGIQFRVDGLRRLSHASALGATLRIYALMWKSFQHLNEVWQDFAPLEDEDEHADRRGSRPARKYSAKREAHILAFKPRQPCDQ